MPRATKESDDDFDMKTVGRRTRATGPLVTDSPLRRSTRHRQINYADGSSPESVVSEAAGPSKRTTRGRVSSSASDVSRALRPRKNSATSDISEVTDNDTQMEKKRVTRRSSAAPPVPDTPTKARLRRGVRAGSESNTMSPSVRVTRRTRASSVDDDGRDQAFDLPNSNNGTPIKTRKARASVQPSEPPVSEEPPISKRRMSHRRVIRENDEKESDKSNTSSNSSQSLNSSRSEKNTPDNSPMSKSRDENNLSKVPEIVEDPGNFSDISIQEIVQDPAVQSVPSAIVPSQLNQTSTQEDNENVNLNDEIELKQRLMTDVIVNSTQNYPKVVIEKTISDHSIEIIETSPGNKENEKFNKNVPDQKLMFHRLNVKPSERKSIGSTLVERVAVDRKRNNSTDEKMMKFVEIIEIPLNPDTSKIPSKLIENESSVRRGSYSATIGTKEHSIIYIDDIDDLDVENVKIPTNNNEKISELTDESPTPMMVSELKADESKCNIEINDEKAEVYVSTMVNASPSINLFSQMDESVISQANGDESDIILSVSINDSQDNPPLSTTQIGTESSEDISFVKNTMSSIVAGNEDETAGHVDGPIRPEEEITKAAKSPKKSSTEDVSIDDPEEDGDSDTDVNRLFQDIPAEEYEGKESNGVDKNAQEGSECDSDETVILPQQHSAKSPKKPELFEEPMEVDDDVADTDVDEKPSEVSHKRRSSIGKSVLETTDGGIEEGGKLNVSRKSAERKSLSKAEENFNDSRKSVGRKSLDKNKENLNDTRNSVGRKSLENKEESVDDTCKSVGRKSLNNEKEGSLGGSRNSIVRNSLGNEIENFNDSRQSVARESLGNKETLNESRKSIGRKSLSNEKENLNDSRKSVGRKSLNNTEENLNDSRKSVGRKSLNNTEENLNDSRKSVGRKSLNNTEENLNDSRKSVGRKSLNNTGETLDDSRKSTQCKSFDNDQNNANDSRKSIGRKSLSREGENLNVSNVSRKSLDKNESIKELKGLTEINQELVLSPQTVSAVRKSLAKQTPEKSTVPCSDTEEAMEADNGDVPIPESNSLQKTPDKRQRKSLNKSLKSTPTDNLTEKRRIEDENSLEQQSEENEENISNQEEEEEEEEESEGSELSLSNERKKVKINEISTIVQLNSDSEEDSLNSDDSEPDVQLLPSFLYNVNSDSGDDDESGENSNGMNSDLEKEYNLNGNTSLKYSDDEVAGDDCRASESDESDSDDDGEDLADFVVNDDEEDEEEAEDEDEEEAEDEEEQSDEEIELLVEEQDDGGEANISNQASEKSLSKVSETEEHESDDTSEDKTEGDAEDTEDEKSVEEKQPTAIVNSNDSKSITKKLRTDSMDSSTPKSNSSDRVALGIDTPRPCFDKKAKKSLNSSKKETETPPKSQDSFKEPKTPKSPLRTSLPKSIEKIKMLNKPKLPATLGLNHSSIEKTNGSPDERQLMKEKLNDTLPPIKLQHKIKASRHSQLNEVIEKDHDESPGKDADNVEALNESKKNKDQKVEKKRKSKTADVSVTETEGIQESKKSKKKKLATGETEPEVSKAKKKHTSDLMEEKSKKNISLPTDALEKARAGILEAMQKCFDKAGKESKKEKENKTIKRLPEDFLETLSDSIERPKKKRKLANGSAKIMPSKSMFDSPFQIPDNMSIEDDFVPLATSGGTTQFDVVDLRKPAKKSKKTAAAFSFRERMLARNPRQPISAFLMYQQKLKASGRDKH